MTANEILNIMYSLRAYCLTLDTTLRWYMDDVNEVITDDTCGVVKTSNAGIEDGHIRNDFIDIAILAKTKADSEAKFAKVFAAIKTSTYIPVKDYVGETMAVSFNLLIKRTNWDKVGNTDGYYQKNITLEYEIIETGG
jgi:hypothetical protein